MPSLEPLEDLQQRALAVSLEEEREDDPDRLWFGESEGDLFVEFHGDPFGDSLPELLELLQGRLSSSLLLLSIRGPDEGANGTRNWDLATLLDGSNSFPRLEVLQVEQTRPLHRNHSILATSIEEDGITAKIFSRAAGLRQLTSPSALDSRFFEVRHNALEHLDVDFGYHSQKIIRNLAGADHLRLVTLAIGNTLGSSYPEDGAPSEEGYSLLLSSSAMQSLVRLVLRNPALADDQLEAMARRASQVPLFIVRWEARYL